MKPFRLEDLPENGWRARWATDAAWRDMLALSLPGHEVGAGFRGLPLDGGLGELAIKLYHQGVFVLPPDATPDELLELAAMRSLEPPEKPAPQAWPN